MRPAPARFPIPRRPPLRHVVAAALALFVGLTVHRTTTSAVDRAAALGDTVEVIVVQRSRGAGATLGGDDVTREPRPRAHVPDGAVTGSKIVSVTGRALRSAVAAGEVLVTDRLAGEGRTGPAALVPRGWRAMAIPFIETPVPAAPGDLVDVIASFDPSLVEGDPSVVVAERAVVVDVDDDAITVAVTRSRATHVAFALANGIVTLALVG